MPSRRRQRPDVDIQQRLTARIVELEERLVLLEARVRRVATQAEAARPAAGRRPKLTRTGRPRPRCPGCRLELPKGRRGESCVWCGFYFEASTSRATK